MFARLRGIKSQPPWLLSEAPNLTRHPSALRTALQEMAHNHQALCAGSLAAEKTQEKLLPRVLVRAFQLPTLRHFPPD
jgi:hypothetical protein